MSESTAPAAVNPILERPSAAQLRAKLEEMVVTDLLGPAGGPDEELYEPEGRDVKPSDRYIVGLVAPHRLRIKPEEVDGVGVESGSSAEEGSTEEPNPTAPTMMPSSIGISFMVAEDAGPLRATARWGRYSRAPSEHVETETGKPRTVWKRTPMQKEVDLPRLAPGSIGPIDLTTVSDEDLRPAVQLRGIVNRVAGRQGGFVVSLFLVNVQDEPEQNADSAWLFQPELSVEAPGGGPVFLARPSHELPAGDGPDAETRMTAMLYRDRVEFAVGHGVSAHATASGDPRRAVRVETRVVPAHEVPITDAPTVADEPKLDGLCLDMRELAETPRADLGRKLRALPDAYRDWITRQRTLLRSGDARLDGWTTEAEKALAQCETSLARIRDGLALLAGNDNAAEAFRFANRAMWQQRVHTVFAEAVRRGEKATLESFDIPKHRTWRTFQLAFILLNLDSVTNLHHPHRSGTHDDPAQAIADLLWFPTGGGKTEAYLGLAAYTMGLRRLQGVVAGRSGECGVAVLMRYTLRLLTLQQFQRATALICACELIRREAESAGNPIWGREPFRIGLWVGARSTPNWTDDAAEALKQTKNVRSQQASTVAGKGSPVQLKSCPWCGSAIEPGRHIKVEKKESGAGRTFTFCGDRWGDCPFSERQAVTEGLPVIVVDEEIYRRLPTLLIATVDKFAQMPWNGAVQMLFGHVTARCARHGFASPALDDTDHPKKGALPATKLADHGPLRPPDLIIQDELHLISGPLGTLTGHYETAIDELCSWDVGGTRVRPKVIASTATIRRAGAQIRSLFLRNVQVFPPQGLTVEDNFFARQRPSNAQAGRRYLGICAPGRRLKAAIIRVYVAHLAAAQKLYLDYGRDADPWMTLVGYFGSMRELAGTRRLVDDHIRARARHMSRRGLADRRIGEPKELTSRLGSTEIPDLLDRLEVPFDPVEEARRKEAGEWTRRPIDVLLATNMVSVGVDVKRLGLMIVAGQPKNTAEYIQATSRVGRQSPGLVCTIYNWARPRDLSHYESFEHYHATFYNHVEALSVTPFAPRAIDRGLTALLVSLVRLSSPRYSPNDAAAMIRRDAPEVLAAVETIADRAALVEERTEVGTRVRAGLMRRLDEWMAEATPKAGGAKLRYKVDSDDSRALLQPAGGAPWSTFTCLNSLRDVEPTVDLVLDDGNLDDEARPFTGTGLVRRATGGAA